MLISYNWLQNYFDEKLPEPEKISEGITFHSFEVENINKIKGDMIFDIKVLPDRAHDCLSHWGIAKEVSIIFGLKIKNRDYKIFEPKSTELNIKIEDDKCLRYMGRIIRNIKVDESPNWIKERLNSIGQKSINNVVDVANFIMFDLGQPVHCFDLDKLDKAEIIVRNAKAGESINLLGNEKIGNSDKKPHVLLNQNDLVITDGETPLAIAGIKGGVKAEVNNNTNNIIIEVANFNPATTRRTAKRVNILTDAVKRYENEISPELCSIVIPAISDLMYSLTGGEVEDVVDVYPKEIQEKIISVSVNYINKRLGSSFSREEIKSVWDKLNFEYKETKEEFIIKIPTLRVDINYPYDLVEEVIRILGYDKLEEKLPEINFSPKINKPFYKMLLARSELLKDGYSEVMTYVFRNKGEIEILASASDKNFLRTNLTDGLKESLKLNQINLPLLGIKNVKIFEIGTIFKKTGEEIHIAYGDKKDIIETTLDKFISSKKISLKDINSLIRVNHNSKKQEVFKPWSLYPFITRDIAVWVPEGTDPNRLVQIYKELGTDLLVCEPKLFDQFTKPASGNETVKTSYAYRLVFQSYTKTLTDEEINKIILQIEKEVSSLGFIVR